MLGAGLATTIVDIGMCVAGVWVCYACRPFKKYRILGRFWVPDWPLFGRLLAIGAPISGTMLLEYGVFAAAALLMGRLGTTALAAHQIALTTASIMFMVPFGVSMAATVRVGHAVGRRDVAGDAARRHGRDGAGRRVHGGDDADRRRSRATSSRCCSSALAPPAPTPTLQLAALLLVVGVDLLHRRRRADRRGRRAARPERHAHAAAVCGDLLLGDRLHRLLSARLHARAMARSASGSACRSGSWSMLLLLIWRFHALTRRGYLPDLATPA